ncbi:hypothetical protein OHT59_01010 [Streptomyces sp. NBC_00243]|uniref:hypothetical protein n=1 Tax=Streptomyces sp. NBC_00243 TaxID=2975688 RepID=UPI002DDAB59C|nr:hypothetical protein [Streptomyces sp. NBC_00243]WRZ17172.1 hypothetical protein OHT59_01010 [Streptomyces sp. NBC_00243]
MSDNERPKPPTRRGGRVLGSAAKRADSAPPPSAELTPEQFAAEQAAAQGADSSPVGESQVQRAATAAPSNGPTEDWTEAVSGEQQTSEAPSAQPSGHVVQGRPEQEPAYREPAGAAAVSSEARLESGVDRVEGLVRAQAAVSATDHVSQSAASHDIAAEPGVAKAAEVAVRPAVLPAAGGATFPVRTEVPGTRHEQQAHQQTAASEGTPWTHGPGRPTNIPEAAVVLNQRIITRESLDSSVPATLKLKKRLKRFALDNELDHLPIGDIVSVALDEWLTTRGF